jgi:hypothetical protein
LRRIDKVESPRALDGGGLGLQALMGPGVRLTLRPP